MHRAAAFEGRTPGGADRPVHSTPPSATGRAAQRTEVQEHNTGARTTDTAGFLARAAPYLKREKDVRSLRRGPWSGAATTTTAATVKVRPRCCADGPVGVLPPQNQPCAAHS